VSVVARQNGVNGNQLFQWRKLYQNGSLSAVSARQSVVPASELADALKQIRELQRMLGKKTMQVVLSVDKMESLKIVALYPTVLAVPALDTLYRRADLQRFRPIKSVFRKFSSATVGSFLIWLSIGELTALNVLSMIRSQRSFRQ